MTNDEWRVRGIDFALAADDFDSNASLEKAVQCFERAGDGDLKFRAKIFLKLSAELRRDDTNIPVKMELDAAALVLVCLELRVHPELLQALLEKLFRCTTCDQKYFQSEIMSKIILLSSPSG